MKTIFKAIGRLLLVLAGLAVLIVLFFLCTLKYGEYNRKKIAYKMQTTVCDTMKTVADSVYFQVSGFSPAEVSRFRCYLLRNGKIIKESAIQTGQDTFERYTSVALPFTHFLLTDSVIIKTHDQHVYTLSGLAYYAYYKHYGMFGPVGDCECVFSGWQMLNGDTLYNNGALIIKKEGMKNAAISKQH